MNRRSPGVGLRRDSAGTRTSKPAAATASPVTVISSQASAWLRYTWPRRSSPGPLQLGEDALEAHQGVGQRLGGLAVAEGPLDGQQGAVGPGAEHREEPRVAASRAGRAGRRAWTRTAPVTPLAQRSSRLDTSAPAATGASKADPSRRVMNASATAAVVRVVGRRGRQRRSGGRPCRRWRGRPRPSTSRVTARASPPATTVTGPGMAEASRSSRVWSTSAGIHFTPRSRLRPCCALVPGRVGATEPRATRRTASTATRPSQATLAPTPVRSPPPPTVTSQPRESADRDGERGRLEAAAERHVGVDAPAEAGTVDRLEPVGQGVVVLRFGVRARPPTPRSRRPTTTPAAGPRRPARR